MQKMRKIMSHMCHLMQTIIHTPSTLLHKITQGVPDLTVCRLTFGNGCTSQHRLGINSLSQNSHKLMGVCFLIRKVSPTTHGYSLHHARPRDCETLLIPMLPLLISKLGGSSIDNVYRLARYTPYEEAHFRAPTEVGRCSSSRSNILSCKKDPDSSAT